MKKLILLSFTALLFATNYTLAQNFPETYTAQPCTSCAPPQYAIVSGGPSISTDAGVGGDSQNPWYDPLGNPMPKTPTKLAAKVGNDNDNNGNTFVTLGIVDFKKDKIKTVFAGFTIGVQYTFRYHVLASRTLASNYAASASLQVTTEGDFPALIASKTTTFSAGVNTNKWIAESVTFTANAQTYVFSLSGTSSGNQLGYANFDISNHPFDCIVPPAQVQLYRSVYETPFPCAKMNLYDAIKSTTPLGCTPVWDFTSTANSVMSIAAASAKLPGAAHYFAFYEHWGCYNTNSSTADLTYKYVETQVSLKAHVGTVDCVKKSTYDLTAQLNQSPYKVRWFDNDKHEGLPLSNPSQAPIGNYYAFYYDSVNGCYSTDKATSDAVFSVVGSTMCCNDPNDPLNQIVLLDSNVQIVSPAQTFDLATVVPSEYVFDNGVVLEWFTNPNHSGDPVSDPAHVPAGTYYAFAHDTVNGCYNTNSSTASVIVTGEGVQLAIKVSLQGACEITPEGLMNHNLQNVSLLPSTDPYGTGVVFPDINSESAGSIVDWIKIEIRSSGSPEVIYQSRSLLLRPDGMVVDINGLTPIFNVQFEPVRIVVKHRNHLPVMSNPIDILDGGLISYDFTTALSQAFNDGTAPIQMKLVNGVWCMIAGDIGGGINGTQDYAVDGADGTPFRQIFKQGVFNVYEKADYNLDGSVEGVDGTIFNNSFNTGYYSIIINY